MKQLTVCLWSCLLLTSPAFGQYLESHARQNYFSGWLYVGSVREVATMEFPEARYIQTIHTVSVTLTISDGDTGLNNFDYDNIDILLNDVAIGLKANHFNDGRLVTFANSISGNFTNALLPTLQDGRMTVKLRKSRGGDNSITLPVEPQARVYLGVTWKPPVLSFAQSSLHLSEGALLTLEAEADGYGTFTYNWTHNGQPLPENGPVLSVEAVSQAHAGIYRLTVTGEGGSVSRNIQVTVDSPPELLLTPESVMIPEDGVGTVTISLADSDTPVSGLTCAVMSLNPSGLFSETGTMVSGGGAMRTLTIRPAPEVSGTGYVTVYVYDGQNTVSRSVQVEVTPVNDAPAFVQPADVVLHWNSSHVHPLQYADIDSAPLQVSAVSDNPGLLPPGGLQMGTESLTITPAPGQYGTAVVTVTVSDGEFSVERSFGVTVQSDPIFTVLPQGGIFQRGVDTHILTAAATGLPPVTGWQWSLNGTPIPGATSASLNLGTVDTADIGHYQVSVYNGISSVSSPPAGVEAYDEVWIGSLENLIVNEGGTLTLSPSTGGSGPIIWQWQRNGNPLAGATEPVFSTLLQAGEGGQYRLLGTNTLGTTEGPEVQVRVNRYPQVAIATTLLETDEDIPFGPINFTVSDPDGEADTLSVSVWSESTELLPSSGIELNGEGSVYSLTLTPASDRSGTASMILEVSDGHATTRQTLTLLVAPVDDPILITPIQGQILDEDTSLTVGIFFEDVEVPGGPYQVTVQTDNGMLFGPEGLILTGANKTWQLTLTPKPDAFGTATVDVFVTDGSRTSQTRFPVTVRNVNDAPRFAEVPDPVVMLRDTTLSGVILRLEDIDTDASVLSLTVTADNPTLFPSASLVLGGSGAERTLSLTPAPGQYGTVTLTLTVSDGEQTAQVQVGVTVQAAPVFLSDPEGGQFIIGTSLVLTAQSEAYPAPSYQWYHNGTPIPGADNPMLDLLLDSVEDSGSYHVQVNNGVGEAAVSTQAQIVVLEPIVIARQPVSLTVAVEQTAEFSITPGGSGPYTYQWFDQDGNPIEGATEATLIFEEALFEDTGDYYVRVDNPLSYAVSEPARLTVLYPVVITGQLLNKLVPLGSETVFQVTATGSEPLSYQWHHNGEVLEGATSAVLRLSSTTDGDAGIYTCMVSNPVSNEMSFPAELELVPAIGTDWEWINPRPTGSPLTQVAYNEQAETPWLAAGDGQIITSGDGLNWTIHRRIVDGRHVQVREILPYGDGFAMFSYQGENSTRVLETTSDGMEWGMLETNISSLPIRLHHLGATYLQESGLYYSTDLQNWDRGTVRSAVITVPNMPRWYSHDWYSSGDHTHTVPLNVPVFGTISKVSLRLSLTSNEYTNLTIKLRSPQGTTITLVEDLGGVYSYYSYDYSYNHDFNSVYFSDSASVPFNYETLSHSGPAQPAQALSGLNGKNSDGIWELLFEVRKLHNTYSELRVSEVLMELETNEGATTSITFRAMTETPSGYLAYGYNSYYDGSLNQGVAVPYRAVSTDAREWSIEHASAEIDTIAYGNGVYVAYGRDVENYSRLMRSSDGINWSDPTGDPPNVGTAYGTRYATPRHITFFQNRFLLIGSVDQQLAFFESIDGNNWAATGLSPEDVQVSFYDQASAVDGTRVVVGNNPPTLLRADTSGNVHSALSGEQEDLTRIVTNTPFGHWILGEGVVLRSLDDGQTWEHVSVLGDSTWFRADGLAVGADNVVLWTGGNFYSSVDGQTFTHSDTTLSSLSNVVWNGEYYVAFARYHSSPNQLKSVDGLNWEYRDTPMEMENFSRVEETGIVWFDGAYYAVGSVDSSGYRQAIYRSQDGFSWQMVFNVGVGGRINHARALRVVNGELVVLHTIAQGNNTVFISRSGDGQIWTSSSTPFTNTGRLGITYGYGHYLLSSGGSTYHTSSDGETWTARATALPGGVNISDFGYAPNAFLAIGDDGAILRSSSEAPPGPELLASPRDHLLLSGQTLRFDSAPYDNSPELTYQWFRNGELLAGENNLVLNRDIVSTADAGEYQLTMTDGGGLSNTYSAQVQVRGDLVTDFGSSKLLSNLQNLRYADGLYVGICVNGIVYSEDAQTWYFQPLPRPVAEANLVYGGGQWLLIPRNNYDHFIYRSTDGRTWQYHSQTQRPHHFYEVAYGAGKFVAASAAGRIYTSQNGLVWQEQGTPATSSLSGITYANDTFVAVGPGGTLIYSTNGMDWTKVDPGTTAALNSVAWQNGVWAVTAGTVYQGGAHAAVYTSTDLNEWTQRLIASGTLGTGAKINAGPSGFVVIDPARNTHDLLYSDAGGTFWQQQVVGTPGSVHRQVVFGHEGWVVGGSYGRLFHLEEPGQVWTSITDLNDVAGVSEPVVLDGKFYTVARYNFDETTTSYHRVLVSADGITWSTSLDLGTTYSGGMIVAGESLVVGRTNGTVVIFTDGNWTESSFGPSTYRVYDLAWSGSRLWIASSPYTYYSDTLGANWGTHYQASREVAAIGPITVLRDFDDNTRLHYSTDGNSFASVQPEPDQELSGLTVQDGQFFIKTSTSNDSLLYASRDGAVWQPVISFYLDQYLIMDDGLYASVSGTGVAYSPDGLNWVLVPTQAFGTVQGAAIDGDRMVVAGTNGLFWGQRNSETRAVRVTADGNGSVSPVLPVVLAPDQSFVASASPAYQWQLEDWLCDGLSLGEQDLSREVFPTAPATAIQARFIPSDVAPSISNFNYSTSSIAGNSFTLSATVSGYPEPELVWLRDGEPIPDAHGNALLFDPLSAEDSGEYTLIATNRAGDTSRSQILDVRFAPVITEQPIGQLLAGGSVVKLSVAAYGNPDSLSYTWYRDGTQLVNSASYTIPFFLPEHAGEYQVRVFNDAGITWSDTVRLDYDTQGDLQVSPGSLLTDFRPSRLPGGAVHTLNLPNGQMLVLRSRDSLNDSGQRTLVLLNADGTVDYSYDPGFTLAGSGWILPMPGGGYLIYGSVGSGGTAGNHLIRLNSDLTIDTGFRAVSNLSSGSSIFNAAFDTVTINGQSVSRLWLAGDFVSMRDADFVTKNKRYVQRMIRSSNQNWVFDPDFQNASEASDTVYRVQPEGNGKAVICGRFESVAGFPIKYVARLNNDGSQDFSFVPPVSYAASNGPPVFTDMIRQADGKYVLTGNLSSPGGHNEYAYLMRLNANGSLDTSFTAAYPDSRYGLLAQLSDGSIILTGNPNLIQYGDHPVRGLAHLSADGVFLGTPVEDWEGIIHDVTALADGGFLVSGTLNRLGDSGIDGVIRFDNDLTAHPLVPGTGTTGTVQCVVPLADGGAFVVGSLSRFNGVPVPGFAKLDASGKLDPAFDHSGTITGEIYTALPLSDGGWLLGGSVTVIRGQTVGRLFKLKADGTLDGAFNAGQSGANNIIYALASAGEGKIYAAGNFAQYNGSSRNRLVRFDMASGAVDVSFDPGSGANAVVYDLLPLLDGTVLIAGDFSTYTGTLRNRLAWIQGNGALDTTRSLNINSTVHDLEATPDGKVYLSGSFTQVGLTSRGSLARIYPLMATVDTLFAPAGLSATSRRHSLAAQSNGKILINSGGVVRLLPDGSPDPDFFTGAFNANVYSISLAVDGGIFVGGSFNTYNGIDRTAFVKLQGDPAPAAPFFLSEPASGIVNPGSSVLLSVAVGGYPIPTVQWYRVGSGILEGAVDLLLPIVNFTAEQAGEYYVVATNPHGEAVSTSAILTLNTPPFLSPVASRILPQDVEDSITLTVSDTETPLEALELSVTTGNPALFSSVSIEWDGLGTTRTLLLRTAVGAVGQSTVVVTVSDGYSSTAIQFVVEVLPGHQLWNSQVFSLAQVQDQSVSGPLADPDGDGIINLLEYALGNDPLQPGTKNQPELRSESGRYVYAYTRPGHATDLYYDVQYSLNLSQWHSLGAGERIESSGGLETWKVSIDDVPPQVFFRIQVSQR